MRLESYAQDMEDIILYTVLGWVKEGFYIDIGANDPLLYSVTKLFYDRGWHGINVDPLRNKCMLLEECRTRDINLCVGIGNERGKLSIYPRGVLSSFSSKVAEELHFDGVNKHEKRMITLDDVYEKYVARGQEVHFCKIDVEGFEKECLEGIEDWEKVRPWVFAMESATPVINKPCFDEWENILLGHDYLFAYERGINRYYLDMQKEHLMQKFEEVDNVIANNDIICFNYVTPDGKEIVIR